ncbi:hypothetical protein FD28_GL000131 [Levilactobacillus hammesii DSM 16381]|uniref:Uncharacterized protein n=2 Tax=Levilactobacillus hammesii TaxID=267633 RepID=A0A0R1V3U3_9LACO|nr:hypothetical protein FD28_GL000131 [Levilactobacillus hammesii DSM 16381]
MSDANAWLSLTLIFGVIKDVIGLFQHRELLVVWLWQYHDWRVWGLFIGILAVYWGLWVLIFWGLRKLKQVMGRNDPPVTKQ